MSQNKVINLDKTERFTVWNLSNSKRSAETIPKTNASKGSPKIDSKYFYPSYVDG